MLLPKLDCVGTTTDRELRELGVGSLLLQVEVGENVESADRLVGRGWRSVCWRVLHGSA